MDDLATQQIYCGTAHPNRKGMAQDLGPKKTELRQGDIHIRIRGDLRAM
jgi:hypothetical protein